MPFVPNPPTLNLEADFLATPVVEDVPIQLYVPTRGLLDIQASSIQLWVPPIYIRVDSGFRGLTDPPYVGKLWRWISLVDDTWYYRVRWWEYAHAGFENEYIQMLVDQVTEGGGAPDSGR